MKSFDFFTRARAAAIHLLLSCTVAILAAVLVFGWWFPSMYRYWAGGQELFILLTSVDLVMGPLLTFAVFDRQKKTWTHLRRDLALIGLLQLSALGYGLWTVYQARPVAMVFEKDRFRIVTAINVFQAELDKAPPAYRRLPLTGPWLLGTREPKDAAERTDILTLSLEGTDRAQRPAFWEPYESSVDRALAQARPLALLLKRYPAQANETHMHLQSLHVDEAKASFVPLMARGGNWIAILDATGRPVHFLPLDGFF